MRAAGSGGTALLRRRSPPARALGHACTAAVLATRALAILTPAQIGPAYFRDMAALLSGSSGPPDPTRIAEVMRRHGLISVPPVPQSGR